MSEIQRVVHATPFGQTMGPQLLTEVQRTFDATWPMVAPHFTNGKTDEGRTKLAKILLHLYNDDRLDRSRVTEMAVKLIRDQESGGDEDLERHNGNTSHWRPMAVTPWPRR